MRALQRRFADNANLIAWLVLIAATGIAWWFGRGAQSKYGNVNVEIIGIMVAAAVKVWIIGFQFMEIKAAPKVLQYGFSAWLIGVSFALILICVN
jgi:hypothetical protein